MEIVIVLVVLAAVMLFISAPLRRPAPSERQEDRRVGDLEAAREAKYSEIRDAELDHSTGKLSDEDYQAVDRALRVEAVEILHQLDRAGAHSTNGSSATITGQ